MNNFIRLMYATVIAIVFYFLSEFLGINIILIIMLSIIISKQQFSEIE